MVFQLGKGFAKKGLRKRFSAINRNCSPLSTFMNIFSILITCIFSHNTIYDYAKQRWTFMSHLHVDKYLSR